MSERATATAAPPPSPKAIAEEAAWQRALGEVGLEHQASLEADSGGADWRRTEGQRDAMTNEPLARRLNDAMTHAFALNTRLVP